MDLLTTDACTLPTTERPLRLAEFDALFRDHVTAVDLDGTTVQIHLRGGNGLLAVVEDLTARESSCCSFFAFTVAGTDEALELGISVPAEQQDLLAALVARARELSA